MRCGKVGHKAMRLCTARKAVPAGKGAGIGFVYTNWAAEQNAIEPDIDTTSEQIYSVQKNAGMRAIIDCGASESIVGALTLQEVCSELDALGFDSKQEVRLDTKFRKSFVFGNNQSSLALGHAEVNTGIHGVEEKIGMHVVEGPMPMLLSGRWLYEQEAIINFKRGQAVFPKLGNSVIQLERTATHHLRLPITAFAGHLEAQKATAVADYDDEAGLLLRACAQLSREELPEVSQTE